jgi:flagellar protein FlgJ
MMMIGVAQFLPILLARSAEGKEANSPERLREACTEFEAIFLGHMLRCMKATVPEGGLIDRSSAHRIFEEMLDEQIAREMAQTHSLGLAETLLRSLVGAESEGTG